jgi:hypothetical protein
MEILTIEYDAQNHGVNQIINGLLATGVFRLKDKEDEFDCDLKRSISGDELINRLSNRIHKMFENESILLTGS